MLVINDQSAGHGLKVKFQYWLTLYFQVIHQLSISRISNKLTFQFYICHNLVGSCHIWIQDIPFTIFTGDGFKLKASWQHPWDYPQKSKDYSSKRRVHTIRQRTDRWSDTTLPNALSYLNTRYSVYYIHWGWFQIKSQLTASMRLSAKVQRL